MAPQLRVSNQAIMNRLNGVMPGAAMQPSNSIIDQMLASYATGAAIPDQVLDGNSPLPVADDSGELNAMPTISALPLVPGLIGSLLCLMDRDLLLLVFLTTITGTISVGLLWNTSSMLEQITR